MGIKIWAFFGWWFALVMALLCSNLTLIPSLLKLSISHYKLFILITIATMPLAALMAFYDE